jgi:hypothetical protein
LFRVERNSRLRICDFNNIWVLLRVIPQIFEEFSEFDVLLPMLFQHELGFGGKSIPEVMSHPVEMGRDNPIA